MPKPARLSQSIVPTTNISASNEIDGIQICLMSLAKGILSQRRGTLRFGSSQSCRLMRSEHYKNAPANPHGSDHQANSYSLLHIVSLCYFVSIFRFEMLPVPHQSLSKRQGAGTDSYDHLSSNKSSFNANSTIRSSSPSRYMTSGSKSPGHHSNGRPKSPGPSLPPLSKSKEGTSHRPANESRGGSSGRQSSKGPNWRWERFDSFGKTRQRYHLGRTEDAAENLHVASFHYWQWQLFNGKMAEEAAMQCYVVRRCSPRPSGTHGLLTNSFRSCWTRTARLTWLRTSSRRSGTTPICASTSYVNPALDSGFGRAVG